MPSAVKVEGIMRSVVVGAVATAAAAILAVLVLRLYQQVVKS